MHAGRYILINFTTMSLSLHTLVNTEKLCANNNNAEGCLEDGTPLFTPTSESQVVYGNVLILQRMMTLIFAVMLGAFSDRFGRKPLIAGACIGYALCGLMYIIGWQSKTWGLYFLGAAILGFFAPTWPFVNSGINDISLPESLAKNTGQMTGAGASGLLSGFILISAIVVTFDSADNSTGAYTASFGLGIAITMIGFIVAIAMPETLLNDKRTLFSEMKPLALHLSPFALFKEVFENPYIFCMWLMQFFGFMGAGGIEAVVAGWLGRRFFLTQTSDIVIALIINLVGIVTGQIFITFLIVKTVGMKIGLHILFVLNLVANVLVSGLCTTAGAWVISQTLVSMITAPYEPLSLAIFMGQATPEKKGKMSGVMRLTEAAGRIAGIGLFGSVIFAQWLEPYSPPASCMGPNAGLGTAFHESCNLFPECPTDSSKLCTWDQNLNGGQGGGCSEGQYDPWISTTPSTRAASSLAAYKGQVAFGMSAMPALGGNGTMGSGTVLPTSPPVNPTLAAALTPNKGVNGQCSSEQNFHFGPYKHACRIRSGSQQNCNTCECGMGYDGVCPSGKHFAKWLANSSSVESMYLYRPNECALGRLTPDLSRRDLYARKAPTFLEDDPLEPAKYRFLPLQQEIDATDNKGPYADASSWPGSALALGNNPLKKRMDLQWYKQDGSSHSCQRMGLFGTGRKLPLPKIWCAPTAIQYRYLGCEQANIPDLLKTSYMGAAVQGTGLAPKADGSPAEGCMPFEQLPPTGNYYPGVPAYDQAMQALWRTPTCQGAIAKAKCDATPQELLGPLHADKATMYPLMFKRVALQSNAAACAVVSALANSTACVAAGNAAVGGCVYTPAVLAGPAASCAAPLTDLTAAEAATLGRAMANLSAWQTTWTPYTNTAKMANATKIFNDAGCKSEGDSDVRVCHVDTIKGTWDAAIPIIAMNVIALGLAYVAFLIGEICFKKHDKRLWASGEGNVVVSAQHQDVVDKPSALP
eukprot:g5651.t1